MINIDFLKIIYWPLLALAVFLGYVPLWFLVALILYSMKIEGTFRVT